MDKNTASSILNDKTKVDQLSKYLLLSLEAHKQGKPKQLNQIFEQMLEEKSDLDVIKLWISIFSRTLIQSVLDPTIDTALITAFILERSKWLVSASHHLSIYDHYEKFCLALISVNNTYLPIILKLLLENLVPKELYEDGDREQNLQIKIGNHSFQNTKDLKLFVAAILRNPKYEVSDSQNFVELDPEHYKFILELLSYHPKAGTKLKNLKKILVGVAIIQKKATRCFFIEKETGEKEDISYLKAVTMVYEIYSAQNSQAILNAKQQTLVENIIGTIGKLLRLYPLSLQGVPGYLGEVFPHRRLDDIVQRVFFTNVLRVSLKFEKLRNVILSSCLEKILQIDVEIKSDGHSRNETSIEMSRKLDWLLLIFFDYIDYFFEIRARGDRNQFGVISQRDPSLSKEENLERLLDRFYDVLELFQQHLLMTYQPRYAQFIFYYLCSYAEIYPDFMQLFLTKLIKNIQNPQENRLIRINSANYLRSAIVRAKFVPFKIARDAVKFLIAELRSQIKRAMKKISKPISLKEFAEQADKIHIEASSKYREKLGENVNTEFETKLRELFLKFDILYYTVIAIAYIFSHKSEEFHENDDSQLYREFVDIILENDEKLQIVDFIPLSILNKLQGVDRFLSPEKGLAEVVQQRLDLEGIEGRKFKGYQLIEDYLPFDPHFLRHSKKILEPCYNFLSEEEREEERMSIMDTWNVSDDNNSRLYIADILGDVETESQSSISKHDTDTTTPNAENLNLKSVGNKVTEINVKRRLERFDQFEKLQKKMKPNEHIVPERIPIT